MNAKSPVALALALLAACGGAQAPTSAQPEAAPSATVIANPETAAPAVQLEADTPEQTASGASFMAPKGWYLTTTNDRRSLQDPDREITMTLIEAKGDDVDALTLAAWKRVAPDFARAVEERTVIPPRDGWDEVIQYDYLVPNEEGKLVLAIARRMGDTWYLTLVDATKAAFDRRAAQAMLTITSFKVAGADEESFAGKTAHTLDGERLQAFEGFVEAARAQYGVPGAAIAIVQGGKVVYEKGLGVRELGKPATITPKTLFMIGSSTKSLTTLMMSKLVDDGRFSWDTPVTQISPTFTLGDAEATKKLTMRDTMCACAGLPRQDMEILFDYRGVTPEQRVAAMKTMTPTTGFGETFQYSNLMVTAGGFIAAQAYAPKKAIGPAYDEAMRKLVFEPLGMKETGFDFSLVKRGDHATPHGQDIEAHYEPAALSDEEWAYAIRPGGGAWSNVRDMARYLLLELGKGEIDGKRVVSEENLLFRRAPRAKIDNDRSYGLGLFVENDHGLSILHHGGNTMGFSSDMFWLPEQGVGMVVLTNGAYANSFLKLARRKLIELLLDGRDQASESLAFSLRQRKLAVTKALEKITPEPDPTWLSKLSGTYENDGLGEVTLRIEQGKGVLDAGEWRSVVGQKKDDDGTTTLILLSSPHTGFELLPGEREGRPILTLQTPQRDYVFERKDAKK